MKEVGIVFSLRGYDIREYEYQSGKDDRTVKVYRITDKDGMKGNLVITEGKTYLTLQEAINEVFLKAIEDILDTHDDKLLNLKQQVKGLEKRLDKAKEIDYLERRLAAVKEEIGELRDAAINIKENAYDD